MKELEERLCNGAYSDAELVTHLQDQNATLREHLLECHKKFNSLQVSMKALASMSAVALGIERVESVKEVGRTHYHVCQSTNSAYETEFASDALCARCKKTLADDHEDAVNPAASPDSSQDHCHLKSPELGDSSMQELSNNINNSNHREADESGDHYDGKDYRPTPTSSAEALGTAWADLAARPPEEVQPVQDFSLDYFSAIDCDEKFEHDELLAVKMPNCPTPLCLDLVFTEDLGPLRYKNILETSPAIGRRPFKLKKTNSPFSDHIDALEQCIAWNYSRWSTSPLRDEQYVPGVLQVDMDN